MAPARQGNTDRRVWVRGLLRAGVALCVLASSALAREPDAGTPVAIGAGDPAAEFLDFSNAWPERISGEGGKTHAIRVMDGGVPFRAQFVRFGRLTGRAADQADLVAWREGIGLDAERVAGNDSPFEDVNALLWRFEPMPRGVQPSVRASDRDRFVVVSASSEDGETRIERSWFVVYDPLPGDGQTRAGEPRGLVVFMPGMLGTPEGTIESTIREIRRGGWMVLRLLSQPSRFTERVEFRVEGDIDEAAGRIAQALTNRAAEVAYSVRAACERVEGNTPGLRGKPRYGVGFSMGAITMPTAVALEPERWTGAVLVGAGCNFLAIASESNYRNFIDAVRVAWIGPGEAGGEAKVEFKPTPEQRDALARAYLARAPLDSYHTARALRGKRVLMVQAMFDKAVPTALGEVLWERLGRPEKWDRRAGHETLFMNLPKDYAEVVGWLNRVEPLGAERK